MMYDELFMWQYEEVKLMYFSLSLHKMQKKKKEEKMMLVDV